jgi:hypothetical protein
MRRLVIALAAPSIAALALLARAEEPARDDLDRALESAKDPARLEDASAALRAIVRKHEESERPRAARALLAAADAAERLGRADEALALYARVSVLFPERKADRDEAERRERALRAGGGAFLDGLLERAAAARGKPRLDRMKTLKVEGAIVMGERRVPFSIAVASGPLRVRQDAPDVGFACGWNGEVGWRRTRSGGLTILSGPALDELVRWAEGTWRDLSGATPGTPRSLGPSTVEGRPAQRVEWRAAGGDPWTVDLDARDALPARATGLALGLEGEPSAMTLYYHGWREVEAARFAERVEYYKGSDLAYTFVYDKVTLDPELEPALFFPPKAEETGATRPASGQPPR